MKYLAKLTRGDITIDSKKLTDLQRCFIDPKDKRLTIVLEFDKVPMPFVNALIREISTLPAKCLIVDTISYTRRSKPIDDSSSERITYGHDQDIAGNISLMPINQKLPIDMVFTLHREHDIDITEEKMHSMTIFSEMLEPSKRLDILPFNRRMILTTLYPGEKLEIRAVVKEAPENLAIQRFTHFARPTINTLKIGTMLNTDPLDLVKEGAERLIKNASDYPPQYKEICEEIKKLK